MTPRRSRLDPATARIRNALRAALDPARSRTYVVAVSGGADSLALAAAAAFLHTRNEGRFLACTVDHGLQEGSGDVAVRVVSQLESLGLPSCSVTAEVDTALPGGLEAAAREARYAALARVAVDSAAHTGGSARSVSGAIVTGHTRDDQAETVLLGLLRGSGARSLSGMAPATRLDSGEVRDVTVDVLRPLLRVSRDETRASCRAQGLDVWDDPMNEDDRFTRVRARATLQTLSESLGQDVRASLARTADLLRDDADHLDAQASAAWATLLADAEPGDGAEARGGGDPRVDAGATRSAPDSLVIRDLERLAPAVRTRVLLTWLRARGVPSGDLTAEHVRGVWEVAAASGADVREVSVPGGGAVRRTDGRIVHRRSGATAGGS